MYTRTTHGPRPRDNRFAELCRFENVLDGQHMKLARSETLRLRQQHVFRRLANKRFTLLVNIQCSRRLRGKVLQETRYPIVIYGPHMTTRYYNTPRLHRYSENN